MKRKEKWLEDFNAPYLIVFSNWSDSLENKSLPNSGELNLTRNVVA